ncbi:unnamed protein product [Arctia plantaginis]|uniref:Uncharacterized protein n=1 Tax=Arctia plantaginis TaxID=874455 RepID=A0A8S0Z2K3_ARCPL|nr:unnamed protein product [Arctia plantaginis]
MKSYCIVFILIIHTASATVDLNTLKESSAKKLQTLEEYATNKIQMLHEMIEKDLKSLQDKATGTYQMIADSIDAEKLKKLDIFNIIPKVQLKGELIQNKLKSLSGIKQKPQLYSSRRSQSGHNLILTYDVGLPWPVKRLGEIEI